MLTKESLNLILNSFNDEEVNGFAKNVLKNSIYSECNLLPSRYMEIVEEQQFRSSVSIQNELDELYGELKKLKLVKGGIRCL